MSAAEISNIEDQFIDFKKDLFKQFDRIEWLTAGTPYSINEMKVDFDVWKDLKEQWEESQFWQNFKEIAPLIFCFAVEQDEEVSQLRDSCVSSEIMKTKAILKYLYKKVPSLESKNINMHHFSTSLKILQEKINIIKALKAPPMDPSCLKIPIFGTNKNLILNIPKRWEKNDK